MRVSVITGASGGLGRELAKALGQHGDSVVIHYHLNRRSALETANQVREAGSKAIVHQADLRDRKAVQEMVQAAVKEWGRIDLWINNAGLTFDRLTENMQPHEWDEVVTTNLYGAFYGIQEAARVMAHQKNGQIVNISSLVGLRGGVGQSAYAASKAGLIGLTKAAARELGPLNIRVNAVLPGYLPTSMTQKLPPKRIQQMVRENVLGRGSDFKEVAQFIFQLSLMQHVSGQVFNLDSRIF